MCVSHTTHSVVVVLCGGNIDTTVLGRCLERGLAADGRLARFTVKLPDRAGSVADLTKFLYEQNARFVQPTVLIIASAMLAALQRQRY